METGRTPQVQRTFASIRSYAQSCILQNNIHQQQITKYFHTKHIAAQILILYPKGLAMLYKIRYTEHVLKLGFHIIYAGVTARA